MGIQLSCRYNVVCSLTSFLAVEKRHAGEKHTTNPDIQRLLQDKNATITDDLISYIGWGEGMKALPDKLARYREEECAETQIVTSEPSSLRSSLRDSSKSIEIEEE